MTKQEEIEMVRRLTKACDEQVKINEIGWTSRVILLTADNMFSSFREVRKHKKNLSTNSKCWN